MGDCILRIPPSDEDEIYTKKVIGNEKKIDENLHDLGSSFFEVGKTLCKRFNDRNL